MLLAISLLFCQASYAQQDYSHVFTQRAQNTEFGFAENVAVSSDGYFFCIQPSGSLSAYAYVSSGIGFGGFDKTATTKVKMAFDVFVGEDGTVFLDKGDTLTAFAYDGSSFSEIGSLPLDDGYSDRRNNSIGPGEAIFIAYEWGGLHAYRFDNTEFNRIASMDDGSKQNSITIE